MNELALTKRLIKEKEFYSVYKNDNKAKTLYSLKAGESGIITKLNVTGEMRRRLQDLGFIEGKTVDCVLKGIFGDPVGFVAKGAIIALRKEELEGILIR